MTGIRFVLVQPRSAGNVGSAARALKNQGFVRLCLVQPDCDKQDPEARMMAVEARDVLDSATVHRDLDDALGDAGTVVGTSRRSGKHRQPHYRLDRVDLASWIHDGQAAFVFGREDSGLTDAELDRCTHLVHFSANEAFPSFNLAQAVLLVAYELRLALHGTSDPQGDGLEPPASHVEREAMYRHLESALTSIGYLHADTQVAIMRRLRRLLGRAQATEREVQMFRGMARQILWAAGRAGLGPADRDPHDESGG